jgi:hypothetical protein
MAKKNSHVAPQGAAGAGLATEQAPNMNPTLQVLYNAKIKDLPVGFYTSVWIGDYYMYINTFYSEPPIVYVEKKRGCGMTTKVEFKDPDPEATVGELFNRAKNLIESSINRNCLGP